MTDDDGLQVDRRHGPGKVPPEVIERMIANSQNLITEAQLLRREIAGTDRERHTLRRLTRIGVCLLLLVLLGVGGLVAIALQNRANGNLLVQCTTPPDERRPPVRRPAADDCFVRTQGQTVALLGEPAGPINTVVVLAAYCARVPTNDTETEVEACVRRELLNGVR